MIYLILFYMFGCIVSISLMIGLFLYAYYEEFLFEMLEEVLEENDLEESFLFKVYFIMALLSWIGVFLIYVKCWKPLQGGLND